MNIQSLIRPHLRDLIPYSSARDEYQGQASVYLDANENPYPSLVNRYPDPLQKQLKEKIGALKKVSADQIFLGNGSDEAIDLLIRAFCEPKEECIVITPPTYGMYEVSAKIQNVTVKTVPLKPGFHLDEEAILRENNSENKILFICSPNNPSGNLMDQKTIERLLEEWAGLVVIDEAYIDFADSISWTTKLDQFPRLAVLQTFSKAWGMAGIRLGMAFGNQSVVDIMNKIKPPYNINTLTENEASKALDHPDYRREAVEKILAERKILGRELGNTPLVTQIYPSDANFLLVKLPNARQVYEYLVGSGIIVRDRSKVLLCEDCLRITVGTPEENREFIQVLRKF